MSRFDEVLAACRRVNARMPPHLAAWVVAHEVQHRAYDQQQLGQALFDLMGGPGPEPLASIVTRMVHPNVEHRFPVDGRDLHAQLDDFVKSSGQPVGVPQLGDFLKRVAGMPAPMESGDWLVNRPALDASGRVTDAHRSLGPAPQAVFEPPKPMEEKLELARPVHRSDGQWSEPAPYRNEPPKRGSGLYAVLGIALLGAGAIAAFMLSPTLQRKLPVLPGTKAGTLLVSSEPDGADVRIDGVKVGKTPFATDNHWRGKVKLEVQLGGYEPFRDTFEGGKDQSVSAQLKRR